MALSQSHVHQGLIYGRVETVENVMWEGVLRWGDEEAFWDDLFLSKKKIDIRYFSYLTGDQLSALSPSRTRESYDWTFWSLWRPRYPT
ncbi:MAG: hypothetical protein NWR72_21090, partial [Bacteroidia bacterium]|nr:hypothetical protein [Bacteroidia bacterium]